MSAQAGMIESVTKGATARTTSPPKVPSGICQTRQFVREQAEKIEKVVHLMHDVVSVRRER